MKAWLAIVRLKRYSSPQEVRQDFASASFSGKWRTVFNIGGNKYRLVLDMRYDLGRIYIRHLLTHYVGRGAVAGKGSSSLIPVLALVAVWRR
ncbi:MAG: type II toxin-antitoxin system HigB family toxin [Candidatus Entotheonellia bacterium]